MKAYLESSDTTVTLSGPTSVFLLPNQTYTDLVFNLTAGATVDLSQLDGKPALAKVQIRLDGASSTYTNVFNEAKGMVEIKNAAGAVIATLPVTGTDTPVIQFADKAAAITVTADATTGAISTAVAGGTVVVPTFTIAAGAGTSLVEGGTLSFTVNASVAPTVDTVLNWAVTPNGTTAIGAGDMTAVSGTVTVLKDATSATFAIGAKVDTSDEFPEGAKITVTDANGVIITGGEKTFTVSDNPNAPHTFVLTEGTDTGSSSPTPFIGAGGVDTFSAAAVADLGKGTTLQAGDDLAGGEGIDILSLSISGIHTADQNISAVKTDSIEQIIVSNYQTGAGFVTTIDAARMTGVTTVGLSASNATGDTKFTTLGNIVAAEMKNGTADLTLGYSDTAVVGTADVQTVTLANQTAGTFKVTGGIEAISVVSTISSNTVTVASDDTALTAINVSGDKSLNLGTLDSTVTKVISTATAGTLKLTGDTALDYSIVGGAGNDDITLAAVATADTVTGGEGTADKLTVSTTDITVATALTNVTGIETLALGSGVDLTIAAPLTATGINLIDVSNTGDSIVTLNAGYTGDTTVKVTGDTASDDQIINNANVTLTVNANGADIDQTTVTGGSANDTINLTADAGTSDIRAVTGVETINVLPGTVVTADITVTGASASDALVVSTKTLTVNAAALTDAGATLTFVGTSETNGYFNVTGGAGDDSITGGTSGLDTLIGGAGNDVFTLVTLAATNTVTGGDGTADKLNVTTDIAAATAFAGVTGVEQLVLGASTDLTLAAPLTATGITSISAATAGMNVITLNTGYTGDTNVILTGDNATNVDKIVNAANVALTVTASVDDIDSGTTITGGTGSDVIALKANATAAVANLAAVTGVETINIVAGTTATDDVAITVNGANATVASGKVLAVNATAFTDPGAVLTFTGTGESDGYFSITGGNGDDVIAGGSSGLDTLIGGAGNDSFSLAAIASTTVVTGGENGTTGNKDTLTITTTDVAASSSLAGVTGIETLVLGTGVDLTLASSIAATGITKISAATAGANIILLNAGYTGDTTVVLTGDATTNVDKVDNSGANVALTVVANADDIDAGTTITGGTGNDVISLTANNGTATTTALTGVETINVAAVAAAGNDIVITMGSVNDAQVAVGKTLVVNASVLASGETLTFTGSTTELDGYVSVTGGAGADTITSGAFTDTMDGGAGSDTYGADISDHSSSSTTTDGTVVNLSSATLSFASVNQLTSKSLANGTTVAPNTATYTYSAESGANFSVVHTLLNFENVTGTTGVDYIVGSSAANTITGGTGGDVLTGGDGVDTFVFTDGDGVTAASTTIGNATATVWEVGETLTFTNGILDKITDFTAGSTGDVIKGVDTGAPTAALSVAAAATTGLAAGTTYYLSGAYSAGVFTIAANGAGADTLIIEGAGTAPTVNTDFILLIGVDSDNLHANNFIA